MTTHVKTGFTNEPLLKDSAIDVHTTNHVVTLKGTVPSAAAKARAEAIAAGVSGVTLSWTSRGAVDSDCRVAWTMVLVSATMKKRSGAASRAVPLRDASAWRRHHYEPASVRGPRLVSAACTAANSSSPLAGLRR